MGKNGKSNSRLWLIIQREYMTIVARKSFIILTLLMPLLYAACIGLPVLLMQINGGDQETVAVIDESHKYMAAIADNEDYKFQDVTALGSKSVRDFYDNAENLYAVVVIPADVDSTLKVTVYSDNAVRSSLTDYVEDCVSGAVTDSRVESFGVPGLKEMLDKCDVSISVDSIQWNDEGGEERSSAELASLIGVILAFLIYMFVLMYGAMIMSSVIEEKTNRIVEVIVSSCRPIELLLGKILGVALVGLTQIAVWTVLMSAVSAVVGAGFMASAVATPGVDAAMMVPPADDDGIAFVFEVLRSVNFTQILVCFVLFFLGGYLLYASLFAALGSAVDQQSDASQFTAPVMIVIVFAMWAGMACMENPDGQLAFWCSMIPFTSPVVMMVRLPYDVPLWQMALSVALLYGTALGVTALAARIYRTGILMYGKKTKVKDLLKWLKR